MMARRLPESGNRRATLRAMPIGTAEPIAQYLIPVTLNQYLTA